MTTQRILILCPDSTGIEGMVKVPSLRGVHFSFLSDRQSGFTALRKENFSAIVAQKDPKRQDAEAFVAEILDLAPKTPLMLILPRSEGPSVLEALKGGASEILFEENLSEALVPCLEKYLFSGHGLLRRLSLDELFDFCIPVITTTEMALLSVTILEKLREALGATVGVLFREGGEGILPYQVQASIGFPDEAAPISFLRRFGGPLVRRSGAVPVTFPADELEGDAPGGRWPLDQSRVLFTLRFDIAPGSRIFAVMGLRGTPEGAALNSPLLNFFHRQARLALINSERNAQAQSLIYIDDLTKLYNSRYLNVVLDREMKRSERYRNFFSVLFMDVDFFKRVNDAHGHLVGSRVLVEVGSLLRSCVRETDTVVRYGGDEFVVLLVETNAEEAKLVAERMRLMVETGRFVADLGLDIRLTISIGISAFPEHANTKQHLLNLADQAMYRGKESSRNVVYLATPQNVS
ncbi:MAG TPA: GGDEF domain-containing protein [Candidatus Deferrimicrobiaceae bacterium]